MSEEVRVTDPKTGGQKGSKLERFDLVPPAFLQDAVLGWARPKFGIFQIANKALQNNAEFLSVPQDTIHRGTHSLTTCAERLASIIVLEGFDPGDELARVYGMGAQKYAPFNWLKGYAWSLSVASLGRHIHLWARGQRRDEESGCHHIAHAIWHCVTLWTFATYRLGTDDLYRTPAKSA